jgi:hypothetical protein
MAVSNQASNNIDESVDRAMVASMLDLRNIFELVNHTFNDGTFSKQELVHQRHQTVFHVFSEFCNELEVKDLQELLKQSLRNVPTICDQLAEQSFAQLGNRFAVINTGRCDLTSQQFPTIIDHQVQFEAEELSHGTFATIGITCKNPVVMNAMVVTYAQSG